MKLPVLFEHFHEHRLEDPSLSFFSFLKMHYEKIVIDDDFQRDQQLPFRDADCGALVAAASDIPPQTIRIEKQDIPHLPVNFSLRYTMDYSHQYLNDIFQPPRQAWFF